ncbi:helix-turn-helix transcriptional regulator [Actinoplanes sp. L3-i22]|uniref:helix-turn-helix transcriptional regulator n=1 Tax=Actinoplanes sp. L3-i22 TaxID=2836373 RepID=UPI001C752CF4|nr:helix-turn-helix transcriptional regulator [Actinoplanes sp. L3-i22]BCY09750.1 transcriptional regulator [Actinoplanes sp. L3-i22]
MDRAELAAFLRSRRARLRPGDVGLPDGSRRRTPGLRRQEVAQLAGMSIDYYIRLEQGRGPNPSRQILAALTRALLLNRDERDYLFRVAGVTPPRASGPSTEIPTAIRYLLDGLPATPAYVVDAKYDILAWNGLAPYVMGDLLDPGRGDRNMIRWLFGHDVDHERWDSGSADAFTRSTVADLRAAYARHPGDAGLAALVTELLGTAPRFAAMWAEHDIEVRRAITKKVRTARLGPLEYECQVLHIPETGQRLIAYCAAPGSRTHQVFRDLASPIAADGVGDQLADQDGGGGRSAHRRVGQQ